MSTCQQVWPLFCLAEPWGGGPLVGHWWVTRPGEMEGLRHPSQGTLAKGQNLDLLWRAGVVLFGGRANKHPSSPLDRWLCWLIWVRHGWNVKQQGISWNVTITLLLRLLKYILGEVRGAHTHTHTDMYVTQHDT